MFCLITDPHDDVAHPAAQLAAADAWRWTGSETALEGSQVRHRLCRTLAGDLRSRAPELIDQEHAAWICGSTGPRAGPRRRPPGRPRRQGPPGRAGSPAPADIVHRRPPRRLDSIPSGAATASLPPPSPPQCIAAPCTTSANAASSPAGIGTATAKPKPGRPSRRWATITTAPWPPRSASSRRPRPDRRRRRHLPSLPEPPDVDRPPVRERHPGRIHAVTLRNR